MKSKVTIQVQSAGVLQDEQVMMIGENLNKQWKIPSNGQITLRIGSLKTPVKVITLPRSDAIRISTGLAQRLGLQHGGQLRVQYKSSAGTLQLGPVIGILLSRAYPGAPDKLFGAVTSYCKEIAEACQMQGAFVYFFTPKEIVRDAPLISGWKYSSGRWSRGTFPIPDIIHNRLTSRKLENQPSIQKFMKEVKSRYHTSIFNEKYLDKTEVFRALRNESSLLRYLPESHMLLNYQAFSTMCNRYPTVFLKPIRGSLGKGIIRISRYGSGISCHYSSVNGTIRKTYPTVKSVYTAISGKMKQRRYQIQQGIQLIEVNRRPVDFRALVQKDKNGKWTVTSIVARIAGTQHFVSNLARGGTLSTVKEAVSKSNLASNRSGIYSDLKKAAVDISHGIENRIPAHFGELGVDLGVDTRGKVWLIEVNSKPSKNDNTQLTDSHAIRPSVRQFLQYAKYLSGF